MPCALISATCATISAATPKAVMLAASEALQTA